MVGCGFWVDAHSFSACVFAYLKCKVESSTYVCITGSDCKNDMGWTFKFIHRRQKGFEIWRLDASRHLKLPYLRYPIYKSTSELQIGKKKIGKCGELSYFLIYFLSASCHSSSLAIAWEVGY